MTERAMAKIVKIKDVIKHPNADSLDICTVGGWKVVTKINEFKKDELVVYFEIDSWIPTEIAPFLSKGNDPKEFNLIKGERLRTAKLRGVVSQGLILPIDPTCSMIQSQLFEGLDVSAPLSIQKYEPPIPACLAGEIKGVFPSFVPKTDQERIQNLTEELSEYKNYTWEVTEKMDGSSCTMYIRDTEFGVCSRNLDLKPSNKNTFWSIAICNDVEMKLQNLGRNVALQGEVFGEGIQKNPYKIKGQMFYVFDIYDIDDSRYLSAKERVELVNLLGLEHVPVIDYNYSIPNNNTVAELLVFAESKSILHRNAEREGLVFKCIENPNISFKVISNRFLLKNGD